ncbi:MAG: M18 family aminopeptidase [Clostridiales Family XIII bacterium]|nr:M18 family aminopeptidase [Clostridia bacterium]MDY3012882.1 M18 family aminopeptidase [Clostridiales Family XIII bacterium]
MTTDINKQLFDFIEKSPSCFHAIDNMKRELTEHGFEELSEADSWKLVRGGRYFVTRNLSSLIAFHIPKEEGVGFHITASHSDSPTFKIKENCEIEKEQHYIQLNVEKYGGMSMAPWLDRPLSAAGRVLVKKGSSVQTRLVSIDRDLLLIPSLAIHMNKEVNDGYKFNAQTDLLPLYGSENARGSFMKLIAEAADTEEDAILGNDLFLYLRMKGSLWGADDEFISCPRLDDLQCAFASLKGFLAAESPAAISVHCTLDNEETGSGTKQGAASTFLKDTLKRILMGLGADQEAYHTMLANSFMLSADNAHAVHPSHTDKTDPTNRPYMNHGVVIKYNANQKYTTDGVSAAIFKSICEKADVPCQTFLNRSDMAGGSTLGNISNTQVPMNTVDIGLAQLAMHTPYETAGSKDTAFLIQAIKEFYQTEIRCRHDGSYTII